MEKLPADIDFGQGYNRRMRLTMKNLRGFVFVFFAATFTACTSAPPEVPAARPSGSGRVEVTMIGFKSDEGQALVALFLNGNGWPDADGPVFATAAVAIRDGQATAEFDDVPAGPFAVSVFHDTDGDRTLDTDAVGIPSEDYGFSADARKMFGPPSFEAASLQLAAGETKQIAVTVK
jgi:uncharacterized protein (DUF2141 family)